MGLRPSLTHGPLHRQLDFVIPHKYSSLKAEVASAAEGHRVAAGYGNGVRVHSYSGQVKRRPESIGEPAEPRYKRGQRQLAGLPFPKERCLTDGAVSFLREFVH